MTTNSYGVLEYYSITWPLWEMSLACDELSMAGVWRGAPIITMAHLRQRQIRPKVQTDRKYEKNSFTLCESNTAVWCNNAVTDGMMQGAVLRTEATQLLG
jgi:hypothetical protein